jgi:hypothetical protein
MTDLSLQDRLARLKQKLKADDDAAKHRGCAEKTSCRLLALFACCFYIDFLFIVLPFFIVARFCTFLYRVCLPACLETCKKHQADNTRKAFARGRASGLMVFLDQAPDLT